MLGYLQFVCMIRYYSHVVWEAHEVSRLQRRCSIELVADLHFSEEPDSCGWDRWMAESTGAAALPGDSWGCLEAETASRAVEMKEAFGGRIRGRFQDPS